MSTAALAVEDVEVRFPSPSGEVSVVHGLSLEVAPGRMLGVVGESGSGKSLSLRAICGLVPPPGVVTVGALEIGGRSFADAAAVAAVRGVDVTMIFQDPATALNPVRTVGSQLQEVLRVKLGRSRTRARAEAVALLDRVGIPDPGRRVHAYPHELSGGQRQRVMIALAIAPEPRVLLADEPTTALDVTTQEQILGLIKDIQRDNGMAVVLVTHDLGVVAQACDDVAAMYAGYVVERGTVDEVLRDPQHPYVKALLAATPSLSTRQMPAAIEGSPPDPAQLPSGCPFQPRCAVRRRGCEAVDMRREERTECACPFERGRR